jgi:hypothetical protein
VEVLIDYFRKVPVAAAPTAPKPAQPRLPGQVTPGAVPGQGVPGQVAPSAPPGQPAPGVPPRVIPNLPRRSRLPTPPGQ